MNARSRRLSVVRPALLWARCLLALVCALPSVVAQDATKPPSAPPAAGTSGAVQGPLPAPDKPGDAAPRRTMPKVVSITVEGARRYTSEQLVAALGQRIGEPYDADAVGKGLGILWDAFKVKGEVFQRPGSGGIDLLLRVEEMNVDLEPRFVGNAEIDVETLKKWALLEDRGELFLFQAERVRQRLIEGYHKEGYAFVEIDVVRRGEEVGAPSPDAPPDVIFEIREGPKVRVKDVVVRGNDSMPETGMWWWKDGLVRLAKTELGGPWLFNWLGEKFVRETLDADILAMREVYRDRGYLDAVVELESLDFTDDRSGVVIRIVVDEGEPYTVSSLKLRGAKHEWNKDTNSYDDTPVPLLFPENELLALCKLAPGRRYARAEQNADSGALRDYYGARGYISHPTLISDYFEFLEPEFAFDLATHQVAVTYRLAQGRKRYVREVLFQGAEHTRDRVLRREVDMLPGEQADLSKIKKSLSRIYSTSFFSNDMQAMEHRDPTFGFKQTGDPDWVDLEYRVEEGKVVNIQLQGGVDSNSGIFGRISLIMRNFDVSDTPSSLWSTFGDIFDKEAFHGAGQELELDLMPGTVVNSYRVRFLEPDIFRTHFNRWSLELDLYRRERTQRFYDEDRNEKRVRLGHEFSREFSAFLGYTNQNIRVSNLDTDLAALNEPDVLPLPDSIYQQEGRTNLSGLTLDFQFRDVDQTLNVRSGSTLNVRNAVYGGVVGGDYDFVKSSADADWFWLIGDPEVDVRPGIHLALGGGVSDNFGDTSETPYTERFFLGGSKILRGFAYRGVGPNRGRNTLGGESYLSGSLEYRYPLYSVTQPGTYRQVETFRLTLFTDAGVLGVDPWDVDFDEVRWTYGFGLGMVQPFPITLNFGFPLKDGEGDRRQVFSFNIFSFWF